MDTNKVRKYKKALEDTVASLVNNFEAETDCRIDWIDVRRNNKDTKAEFVAIQTKVELR